MYEDLVARGVIVPAQEVPPPTVPMDYSWARVGAATTLPVGEADWGAAGVGFELTWLESLEARPALLVAATL